jgi:hypothetical protein
VDDALSEISNSAPGDLGIATRTTADTLRYGLPGKGRTMGKSEEVKGMEKKLLDLQKKYARTRSANARDEYRRLHAKWLKIKDQGTLDVR